jgi:cytidylate kinase
VPVIAIDGPAGAGKSTVARLVAARTGLPYLDTGAMYRCVALAALRQGADLNDNNKVGGIALSSTIVINESTALLNGEDVSDHIRGPEISGVVSVIATHSSVRDAMREQQRVWIRNHGGGVVEGRDIGTVVFPDAEVKIFLTASPEVRAQRRVQQTGGDVDAIASNIAERDRIDSTRSDSPLKPADDSHKVDSSNQTIDDVVDEIVGIYEQFVKRGANG